MSTVWAVLLLAVVLAFAVVRPRGLPEAAAAVPAAAIAVGGGLVPWAAARDEMIMLGPTVGFLAAILALAHLADAWGVFGYAGALAARASRGSPTRLLTVVFGIAAAVTAVLSLDATVVLLTPVVFATAAAAGVRARPQVYACTHLANAGSLLLPVANLTNLLAFGATGLTFLGFAGMMALPWLAVLAVEYAVFRWFFAGDLATPARPAPVAPSPAPRFALVVLALTLAGFAAAEPMGVAPAWVAAGGAVALAVPLSVRAVGRRLRTAREIALSTNPLFCFFVFGLGVVVLALRRNGLDDLIAALTPSSADFLGLLAVAALAALLANIVNNVPATLVLVPVVAHTPGLVLAALIGVNIGPNLTYVGSLATLLWRRILHARDEPPSTSAFLRLGAVSVPACLLAAVVALWVALKLSTVL
ncbi:ArsB/NhaD family transporter [Asanoa hainanensis]|uniref:ArsB/NhaD family transporter n=1 Tax=Asanoa hainanensis TaxID=560556 RepID=UPI000B770599|nr:ArsB/NhaD family transporter [Asanoa hainanensis]